MGLITGTINCEFAIYGKLQYFIYTNIKIFKGVISIFQINETNRASMSRSKFKFISSVEIFGKNG